jgi:hypothetical protein
MSLRLSFPTLHGIAAMMFGLRVRVQDSAGAACRQILSVWFQNGRIAFRSLEAFLEWHEGDNCPSNLEEETDCYQPERKSAASLWRRLRVKGGSGCRGF